MIYENAKTKNISFPLGGIGTGCIGLSGNGSLVDWEIFNRPNKNTLNGNSHFALKVKQGEKSLAKVLVGDTNESLMGAHDAGQCVGFGYGPHSSSMAGFPHFKNVKFDGKFPIAKLELSEDEFPIVARLKAFNPFIPHNDFDSSLPAAFFEWELENLLEEDLECALAFSVRNPAISSENKGFSEGNINGVFLKDSVKTKFEIGYRDLCVLSDNDETVFQSYWYRGRWQDSCTMFWKNFLENDTMTERNYKELGKQDHCSLVSYATVPAKSKKLFRFVLAWNVPNQYNYWNPYKDASGNDVIWKNYYARQFESSKEIALYGINKFETLYSKTQTFSDAIWSSSLPEYVLDAISSNLSVLKSPTVLRLEDGSLWAWEGCNETSGSCEGSCQHVWNYAYALPFLFPKLERSLRENTLKYALMEDGATKFRISLPVGRKTNFFRSCVDGHMGEIIKCYREWKISGDDGWLKQHVNDIFKMIEYAWSPDNKDHWDEDKDGVLEGRQHHTLDMELFGPSSWLEGFYLLALDCAAQIADAVGDSERASDYRILYNNGKKWMNENLFNGEYFCQKVDLKDKEIIDRFNASDYWNSEAEEIKYQVADGCIIDQMLAEWHAAIIGTDSVFDSDKKQTALKNLYKNNYKSSMRDVTNRWRIFAVNDEAGTVICSYPPNVKSPTIPIPYVDECMTGFEYALAGLMIANGLVSEGESMVKAVRDRYDGEKRNPWNEIECGSNYARSMASYSLMIIYSGFSFDMTKKHIGFSPVTQIGRFVWSVANTWGTVEINEKSHFLSVCGDAIEISSYGMQNGKRVKDVYVDGEKVNFMAEENRLVFENIFVKEKMEIKFI